MRADELAAGLHGYTGTVGYDTSGALYVPVLAAGSGVRSWVKVGQAYPIWYGIPDSPPTSIDK